VAVLLTDGDQRSSLAVVRSLGRAGVEVCVGESHQPCLAGSSKYCARRFVYPSLRGDSEQLAAALRSELESGKYELLLPMTDITVQLVATCRNSYPSGVRIPFPGAEQIRLAMDKQFVLETAQRIGIPCPETLAVDDADLERFAQGLRYPVVIKPRMSKVNLNREWIHGSVRFARDAVEFVKSYREAHAAIPRPIVQEKLEGEGRGVFLLIWGGELRAAFCHRRLREKPPWGGVSVYCESVPLDRELVDKSYELMKSLGWEGVAMVEFKVDSRDRRPKLMEVNGRFWGSLQLAVDAGIDFPYLLYRCVLGESFPAQMKYKSGIRSRWLLGDLDHLLIKLTHSQTPDGARYTWGSRLRSVLSFLKPYERGRHSEVQRFGDMAPGWYEMKTYLRNNLRGGKARNKGAHAG
jgi:predicted ATP-grasp superfamily ATP-dependent carboligase